MNQSQSTSTAVAHRTRWTFRASWWPWIGLTAATGLLSLLVVRSILMPVYEDPNSRLYTSRLGYVAMKRRRNEPFPVTTCSPQFITIAEHYVGEGFVRSTPILVPIVPASRIKRVLVSAGERVTAGQTLAQLDTSHAELRVKAARTVLEIAQAELERTKIGSSYLMEQERPEVDAIRLRSAEDQIDVQTQLSKMHARLAESGNISKAELLKLRAKNIETIAELREAQVSLEQSLKGRTQSIRIAAATVAEAELALQQRLLELKDHEIIAPADGVIERRLIQAGEYNQSPGKPAFLLASGIWFEAYFDQTVFGKISTGDEASISLEAFAGIELQGRVSAVHPFVSFSSGGPESTRPIRPSGTGSPEWPSTFSIRVDMTDSTEEVAAGLSGLVRLTRQREVLAIPSQALHSRTTTKGIVLIPNGDQFEQREIIIGASSDGWIEVRAGMTATERLITKGHLDLAPGDTISIEETLPSLLANQEPS
jgi:multidrug resistance efflux pump